MAEMRQEKDSLGVVEVPAGAMYGAQTARAVENYPISGMRASPVADSRDRDGEAGGGGGEWGAWGGESRSGRRRLRGRRRR